MLVQSGRPLFGDRTHAIYGLLRHMEPGLFLDVGAAAGHMTAVMRQMSPQSRVIAFEPFPGNFPYIEKIVGDDPQVTLIKKAVADVAETQTFAVPAVVKGTEAGGWAAMTGYSSLGYLTKSDDPLPHIEVEVCVLDEVVQEHVRFMKIDVQGAEERVLRGAKTLIEVHGVDVIFIEYMAPNEILAELAKHGFIVYDHEYALVPRDAYVDLSDWTIHRENALSNGHQMFSAWPVSAPTDKAGYEQFMLDENARIGGVWNDLVAVSPAFHDTFLEAVRKNDATNPSEKFVEPLKRPAPPPRPAAPPPPPPPEPSPVLEPLYLDLTSGPARRGPLAVLGDLLRGRGRR